MAEESNYLWWQTGVIYQIYPRSFKDTTGNGVGDLRGVIEQLPYLTGTLGVQAIWLSPFYPSPMADFGYDVADYRDVDPLFGTLADFDELVESAHARDLRVIIDLVPNPSFIESSPSSQSGQRRGLLFGLPFSSVPRKHMRAERYVQRVEHIRDPKLLGFGDSDSNWVQNSRRNAFQSSLPSEMTSSFSSSPAVKSYST